MEKKEKEGLINKRKTGMHGKERIRFKSHSPKGQHFIVH